MRHIRLTVEDDTADALDEIKDELGYSWTEMMLYGHDLDFFEVGSPPADDAVEGLYFKDEYGVTFPLHTDEGGDLNRLRAYMEQYEGVMREVTSEAWDDE